MCCVLTGVCSMSHFRVIFHCITDISSKVIAPCVRTLFSLVHIHWQPSHCANNISSQSLQWIQLLGHHSMAKTNYYFTMISSSQPKKNLDIFPQRNTFQCIACHDSPCCSRPRYIKLLPQSCRFKQTVWIKCHEQFKTARIVRTRQFYNTHNCMPNCDLYIF